MLFRFRPRLSLISISLIRISFMTLLLPVIVAGSMSDAAFAHDWYPMECCHGMDCAPVDRVDTTEAGGMTVTSRHGTAVIPENMPRRESRDQRMHVCMQPSRFGRMRVICVFVPPST